MPTKIDSVGGYQQGYDDGQSAGYNSGHSAGYSSGYSDGTNNGRGKLRVTQLYGFSVANQYSSVIDTGGTGSKTLYIAMGTIRDDYRKNVYIVAQGSNDGNSWADIARCNNDCNTHVITSNYRYFRLYSHREASGDIASGEIATLAD